MDAWLACMALAAIGLLAELIRRALVARMKNRPEVIETLGRIETAQREAAQKRNRIEDLHRESAEAQSVLAELRAKSNALDRRLARVRKDQRIVIEIGRPGRGHKRHDADVFNPRAGFSAPLGDKRGAINPIYAKDVQIVIWASSEAEAEASLASAYPGFAGYENHFRREAAAGQ